MKLQSKIRGQNVLSRTVGRVSFQPQVMNCHHKRSVTEKQFLAPLQLPPPTLIQKVNEKKKEYDFPPTSDV